MLQREASIRPFVFELGPINRFSSSPVVVREIASLKHKLRNDSTEEELQPEDLVSEL